MVACMFTDINCYVYRNRMSPTYTFTLPFSVSLFVELFSWTCAKEVFTNTKEPWVSGYSNKLCTIDNFSLNYNNNNKYVFIHLIKYISEVTVKHSLITIYIYIYMIKSLLLKIWSKIMYKWYTALKYYKMGWIFIPN